MIPKPPMRPGARMPFVRKAPHPDMEPDGADNESAEVVPAPKKKGSPLADAMRRKKGAGC